MNRERALPLPLLAVLILAATLLLFINSNTTAATVDGQIIQAQYIVLTADGVDPATIAADHGLAPRHVYRVALDGFVAAVPGHRLVALQSDPRVTLVEPERIYQIVDQTLPTGIDRIEMDRNPKVTTDGSGVTVNLDVAIIDTGIQADHADLNVAGDPADHWGDRNGHGTHVAGTVAAIDNAIGVVGVAPGVRVWAVRVCKPGGICLSGDIVAGIDWVTEQKANGAINFAAANYSISSADSDNSCDDPANAIHAAI
jgi:subtilisin